MAGKPADDKGVPGPRLPHFLTHPFLEPSTPLSRASYSLFWMLIHSSTDKRLLQGLTPSAIAETPPERKPGLWLSSQPRLEGLNSTNGSPAASGMRVGPSDGSMTRCQSTGPPYPAPMNPTAVRSPTSDHYYNCSGPQSQAPHLTLQQHRARHCIPPHPPSASSLGLHSHHHPLHPRPPSLSTRASRQTSLSALRPSLGLLPHRSPEPAF